VTLDKEIDRVGLVDVSLFHQCGLKIGENCQVTCRVGTKVCPKAMVANHSTTPPVKSGMNQQQTQPKKIVVERWRAMVGTRGVTACLAKTLNQRRATLKQRRVPDNSIQAFGFEFRRLDLNSVEWSWIQYSLAGWIIFIEKYTIMPCKQVCACLFSKPISWP
jgi:hypothetical protein